MTPEDFKLKNITSHEITKLDPKEKNACIEMTQKMNEDLAIYICKPNKDILNIIFEIHLRLKIFKPNIIEYIVFIPKENYDIIEYMSTMTMISEFKIENFNVDLLPIDLDLLSLEKENSIKEIYIDNDYSCISDLANAVVKLETCFGKIIHQYVKGDLAEKFSVLVKEKEKENNLKLGAEEILGMVVFDRSVDFLTLMTTNYTCEGLIDETFGINLGKIKVKNNLLTSGLQNKNAKSVPNKDISYALNSNANPFFNSISCMRYFDAIKYITEIRIYYQNLMEKNKRIKSLGEDAQNSLKEAGFFISNLRQDLYKSENLINYVVDILFESEHQRYKTKEQTLLSGDFPQDLYSYYDEFLYSKKDLSSLIKLMVIESITQNGIKGYQKLKREILNIFGYQKIFLFRDLEILGWLKEKEASKLKNLKNMIDFNYSQILEKLQLINQEYNPTEIKDSSYVLNGYCPLSLKIIEKAVMGQWSTIIDTLRRIPGATNYPEDESLISNPTKDKNIILIVFVGGITYKEIAAIRLLNRKFKEEYKNGRRKQTQFIILTTSILNSKQVFDSLGKEVHSILNMKMFYEAMSK